MSVTLKEVSPVCASLLVPCYAQACLRGYAVCGDTGVPQNILTLRGVLATGTNTE